MSWRELPLCVLKLQGPKAQNFLKNYSCNDPAASLNAFLDLRGRAVAVFFALRKSDGEFWLGVSPKVLDRLKAHLRVYLDLTGCSLLPADTLRVFLTTERPRTESASVRWLESRGAGLLFAEEPPAGEEMTEEQLTGLRLKRGLPIQGVDFDLTLILNLGDLSYVSLTKGCYLGQEIVARVHYRSKPPLCLEGVRESDVPESSRNEITSSWRDPQTGEKLGFWMKPTAG